MSTATTTRWLTDEEQRTWRTYLMGTTQLTMRLDRDLQEEHDLSLPEYEIMVRLSEADEHRMRMSELADSLNHSRSRLTHTVARMERDALVERISCPSDGRGIFAHLTDTGFQRLADAAPTHVAGVRRNLIDITSPEDLAVLERVFGRVAETITGGRPWPGSSIGR
ncbi:MAG: MarR family winged helix-turn-helix transcriptional regulator [Nocardioidaceae bacterium]